jgi:peptide/nickel transport system permease protein
MFLKALTARMRFKLAGGGIILAVVFIMTVANIFVPSYDAQLMRMTARLKAPTAEHILGTDILGRDTLARLLIGTRVTVQMSLGAMLVAFAAGVPLGWLAARFARWLGALVKVIAHPFFIAPAQLLSPFWPNRILMPVCTGTLFAIVVAALVRPGQFTTAFALGIWFAPAVAYVTHRALEAKAPHAWFALTRLAAALFAWTVLAASALDVEGLGVQPPAPSWGSMIGQYRTAGYSWSTLVPLACLLVTFLGALLLSDSLTEPRPKAGARAAAVL